jgi:3-oxoacyl-[acyl-carrier protein] reductase
MELQGTVAVVTGATGGLGQRIGRALAAQGAHIAGIYQTSQAQAEALVAEWSALGPRSAAFQADVTDPVSIQQMVERILAEFGRIDILVNDAAYNQLVPFKDLDGLTLELWERILRINTTGPFLCVKAVAPVMQRQKKGRIVNVTSVAGLAPSGSSIAYAVSKAALTHLTRCLAVALGPEIAVNAVAPGLLRGTKMTVRLSPDFVERGLKQSALQKFVDLDDVADQVVTFCRSDSTTGQVMVIDAGRVYH